MNPLTAARAQMEVSLGFHMVFAALGIGMPLLMVIAEGLWLRTKREHYRQLARTWGKATALLFAIGAVSGTALSFELGLLWPRFMQEAGERIGPAFVMEGYAFFVEAIFVGLYLYGWDRLSAKAHFLCGIPVALSGVASGALVVAANAWMQLPILSDDPFAPFESPVYPAMAVHSTLSCYIAVGFGVAGVCAVGMLRNEKKNDAYHRSGLGISLAVAAIAAGLQLVSGDASAKAVARYEPAKLAAMEAHFETARGVPLVVGGLPDEAGRKVSYAIRLPKGLSFLAFGDPNAEVRGLEEFPSDERPHVLLPHLAFQTMVGCGTLLAVVGAGYWLVRFRLRKAADKPLPRLLLQALALASPLGFLALEAGWVVTEVGRQPWIIRGVMRTKDAVTPQPAVNVSFWGITLLYLTLGVVLVTLLRYIAHTREQGEHDH